MGQTQDIIVSSLSGGLVRLAINRPKKPIDFFISLGAGCITAYFVTDPIMYWLKFSEVLMERFDTPIGFALGFAGLILMERVLILAKVVKINVGGVEVPPAKDERKEE